MQRGPARKASRAGSGGLDGLCGLFRGSERRRSPQRQRLNGTVDRPKDGRLAEAGRRWGALRRLLRPGPVGWLAGNRRDHQRCTGRGRARRTRCDHAGESLEFLIRDLLGRRPGSRRRGLQHGRLAGCRAGAHGISPRDRRRGRLCGRGRRDHGSGHPVGLPAGTTGIHWDAAVAADRVISTPGIGVPAVAGVHGMAFMALGVEQPGQATPQSAAPDSAATAAAAAAAAQFPAAGVAGADTGRHAAAPHRRDNEEQTGAQTGEQLHGRAFGERRSHWEHAQNPNPGHRSQSSAGRRGKLYGFCRVFRLGRVSGLGSSSLVTGWF